MKCLVQAMGRAHRHEKDFGAVVVIDSRLEDEHTQFFPPWIRRDLATHMSMRGLCQEVARFYQDVQYRRVV